MLKALGLEEMPERAVYFKGGLVDINAIFLLLP